MSTYSDPALILPGAVGTTELADEAVTAGKLGSNLLSILTSDMNAIKKNYSISASELIAKTANVSIGLVNAKTHEITCSDNFRIPGGVVRLTLSHFCDTYPTVTYTIVVAGQVLHTVNYGSSSGGRQTKTLDVSGINPGDTIELWAVKSSNYSANVQDFKLLGSFTDPMATPTFS